MLAFKHNSKEFYLDRATLHEKSKDYRQDDYYFRNGKGSALGCLAENDNNPEERLERESGIPAQLWLMMDSIFEGLPNGKYQTWAKRFIQSIEPNSDLRHAVSHFVKWLLGTELQLHYDPDKHSDVDVICTQVMLLHKNLINEHYVEKAWREAQSKASKMSSNLSYAAAYSNTTSVLTVAYVMSAINYAARLNTSPKAIRSVIICAAKSGLSYDHMAEILLKILKEIGGYGSNIAKGKKGTRHLSFIK